MKNKIPSLTLQAILNEFGKEDFYRSDFDFLVKSGHIIEKTRESQHVEYIKWIEPLTSTVYIEHRGVYCCMIYIIIEDYRKYFMLPNLFLRKNTGG